MLDAIAEIDNLGMEESTLAADASPTSLDTNGTLSESQGSSIQEIDFNQSLMNMLSSLDVSADAKNPSLQIVSGQSLEDALADAIPGLDPTITTPPDPVAQDSMSSVDAPADAKNPSLQIVSGQSLEDALADAIPGLDPTAATPPDPLAQDSRVNPFMMAAISELDNPESLGEAFQTVSDGFEGLSDSFERLAASFLAQDDIGAGAIAANDDTSAELKGKNLAIANAGSDTDLGTDKMAIAPVIDNAADTHVDQVAIANNADASNADFGISNMTGHKHNVALGTEFNLDFDALKVNVDQVSRGLQFLVQQLESAFEF